MKAKAPDVDSWRDAKIIALERRVDEQAKVIKALVQARARDEAKIDRVNDGLTDLELDLEPVRSGSAAQSYAEQATTGSGERKSYSAPKLLAALEARGERASGDRVIDQLVSAIRTGRRPTVRRPTALKLAAAFSVDLDGLDLEGAP